MISVISGIQATTEPPENAGGKGSPTLAKARYSQAIPGTPGKDEIACKDALQ